MFEQMKTKSFVLLLMCIVVTGIFVCMFGDPKPTFHELVSKTHRQLSQLKQLKVVAPEEKEPGADEAYLKSLGFVPNPRLYPTHVWSNVTLPVVATAANSGQSRLAISLVKSLYAFLPEHHLIIFDLGLDDTEMLDVLKFCNATNCSIRKFDYDSYPSHVGNTKFSAHRPIIIQNILNDAGAVIWLDVDFQVNSGKIQKLLEQAQRVGLVSWTVAKPTSTLTHPRMYSYFQTRQEMYFFHHMAVPSHLIVYNTESVHTKLMLPWLQCILTLECIAPIGAQSSGCRFDKKPYYRYSGCHRYDMSALNVVLGKMFNFKASLYVASEKEKFFKRTELEAQTEMYRGSNVTNKLVSEEQTSQQE